MRIIKPESDRHFLDMNFKYLIQNHSFLKKKLAYSFFETNQFSRKGNLLAKYSAKSLTENASFQMTTFLQSISDRNLEALNQLLSEGRYFRFQKF